MSEDASHFIDGISSSESEAPTFEENASEQERRLTGTLRGARQSRSADEMGEGSSEVELAGGDRQMLESLKKIRDRALAGRRRAIADTFVLADQCKAFAQRLPKAQLLAFIRNECRVSRTEANAYLQLADFADHERVVIEQSAVDVGVLCRLAKQPAAVQAEALTVLRSGRTLSLADLRLLRRDVLAGDARNSSQPDRSAVLELRRVAKLKAKDQVDRSAETLARVEALAVDARKLAQQLRAILPADVLSPDASRDERSWITVHKTLELIAEEKLCYLED